MSKPNDASNFRSAIERKVVLAAELMHKGTCITFDSQFDNPRKLLSPGGMCSCCGAGPRVTDEHDWWLVFKAGLSDSDGVFYSMLCVGCDGSGCLPEVRAANARRKPTFRDEAGALVMDLMGDDIDGAESMMDDADFAEMFELPEDE